MGEHFNQCAEHNWELINQYSNHVVLLKCKDCGIEAQFEQQMFADD